MTSSSLTPSRLLSDIKPRAGGGGGGGGRVKEITFTLVVKLQDLLGMKLK